MTSSMDTSSYFFADTGVVLRAIEVEADVILLAKAIDGVYNADPAKDPTAKKYDGCGHIHYLKGKFNGTKVTV